MFVIPVTKVVGGDGFPPVTYDWLSVRVTQNPLHASILIIVTHQVLSAISLWHSQYRIQDFPRGGGANSLSGYANLFFRPKTAWKWKNLDPRGRRASVPGALPLNLPLTVHILICTKIHGRSFKEWPMSLQITWNCHMTLVQNCNRQSYAHMVEEWL